MNLIKYRPLALTGFDRMFDNLFEDDFWSIQSHYPKVDVLEDKDNYVLQADLPGLAEKDVEVKVEHNLLSLASVKNEEKEEKKDGYILRERKGYSFTRSFVLPEDTDKERIKAEFKNGVLTITLGKIPQAQPKKIEIKST